MTATLATRTAHAEAALDAYTRLHGKDDDAADIGDLIADLLHLAERRGVLPSEMDTFVARAVNHYEYEADPDNASA